MASNKMKLTSELSLKEMALDSSQFYIPKKVKVDFTQVRPRNKYKDGKATDVVESYMLNGIDERTAGAVEQGLIDMEDIKTITIEVLGSFDEIEGAMAAAQFTFVELLDTRVMAQWVDGRNPGYKGLKLVASGLKLL
ncbi:MULTISPECIES: hypothetical protein [Streptococcus]|uniref:Uncharacterized protein n=5 Tax=root TaxID=1 RepID=A0A412PMZ4_STRAP|nr:MULTISPECIES: hypothetical protein [Streptococcus]ETI82380.1 MAG: hypothetical protein Q615_SPAC00137G0110 [Streptococcus anginosus DORA_7]EPU65474.1 hypothetical protein SAG0307_06190 [Streptococcus agalactiae GB00083]KAA9229848.1 hypothetical protein F6I38_04055 [Streptococcus anginosus]KAA9230229.1 hypothetical protein F6I38_03110 [Streptococcus anginosus]KAA9263374.1 hypothetical protein F6I22_00175 [Streptococcus anginosus]